MRRDERELGEEARVARERQRARDFFRERGRVRVSRVLLLLAVIVDEELAAGTEEEEEGDGKRTGKRALEKAT